MGLKFNISEGEVKRILNLHRQAIIKENKIQINEGDGDDLSYTVTSKKVDFERSSGGGFFPELRIFKGAKFVPVYENNIFAKKLVAKTQFQFVDTLSGEVLTGPGNNESEVGDDDIKKYTFKGNVYYGCDTGKFKTPSKSKYSYYAEDSPAPELARILTSLCARVRKEAPESDEPTKKVDKCNIRKPQLDGKVTTANVSYYYDGKSKCEYGQGSNGFSTMDECTKKCITQKKTEDEIKQKWDIINPDYDDDDIDIRNGESDDDWDFDGESSDCNNRHKTLTCSSSQRNCNEKSIRAQALINCKCPSYILDAVLRGYPKARTGNPGSYTLKEDGIWGPGSKAAWETCESPIRSGSSRNDYKKDEDKKDEDKKDEDKKDEKDTPKPTPEKDLRLTPEEFAQLIQ